jgi:hypothetical protein
MASTERMSGDPIIRSSALRSTIARPRQRPPEPGDTAESG